MANKTVRFHYKPTREIVNALASLFIYFLFYLGLRALLTHLHEGDDGFDILLFILWALWLFCAIIIAIDKFLSIYIHTHRLLEIGEDEITYSWGWISKHRTTIRARDIRSCSKHASVLQRLCGTMSLSIVTAGDTAEIYFSDIECGDRAERLILSLLREQEIEL